VYNNFRSHTNEQPTKSGGAKSRLVPSRGAKDNILMKESQNANEKSMINGRMSNQDHL
jgi:hypothetical protein